MSSRFVQGDGYPILKRYNASDVLQETVNLPYVRDDSRSYIKQTFIPYPDQKVRIYDLLSGAKEEDPPIGYQLKVQIKYQSISAADLLAVYTCIINSKSNTGHYLKLTPRSDKSTATYKVIFNGNIPLESANAWNHNVEFEFLGKDLLSVSLVLNIPS